MTEEASMATQQTKREKLDAAIDALHELLDRRLSWSGGYPAQILGPYRGLLFVADADHDGGPEGTVIDITTLVEAYDVAVRDAKSEADDAGGDAEDYFQEAFSDAYYEIAAEPDDCEG